MSKIASRTRSEVGRVAWPAGARRTPAAAAAGDHAHGRQRSGWAGRASALEQEGGLGLADEEPDLVGELGALLEGGVLGQQRLGHAPGRLHQRAVAAPQRRQLQVAAALLAGAQDGALAPQLEVDLGQLEAVGGALEGLEAARPPPVTSPRPKQVAPRRPVRSPDAAPQLVQLGDPEPIGVLARP